jgi:hypothetical protein
MAEAPVSPAAMQNDPSDATGSDSAGPPEKRRSTRRAPADQALTVPEDQGRRYEVDVGSGGIGD